MNASSSYIIPSVIANLNVELAKIAPNFQKLNEFTQEHRTHMTKFILGKLENKELSKDEVKIAITSFLQLLKNKEEDVSVEVTKPSRSIKEMAKDEAEKIGEDVSDETILRLVGELVSHYELVLEESFLGDLMKEVDYIKEHREEVFRELNAMELRHLINSIKLNCGIVA